MNWILRCVITFFNLVFLVESLQPKCEVKASYSILPPHDQVMIGSTLEFTCVIRVSLVSLPSPTISSHGVIDFLHEDTFIATDCDATQPRAKVIKCDSKDGTTFRISTMVVHVQNISWYDRGDWTCHCPENYDRIWLNNILVSGEMEPIQVDLYYNQTKFQKILPLPLKNPQSKSSSSNKPNKGDLVIKGYGTSRAPLDLRSHPLTQLRLMCRVSCSNPAGSFSWQISNENGVENGSYRNVTLSKWSTAPCESKSETRGMRSGFSEYMFQCSHLRHLMGPVRVTCEISGTQYRHKSLIDKQRHVFVICKDDPNEKSSTSLWEYTTRLEFFLIILAIVSATILMCTCICICTCDRHKGRYKMESRGLQSANREYLQRKEQDSTGATKESLFVVEESLSTVHSNSTSLIGTSRFHKDEDSQIAYV